MVLEGLFLFTAHREKTGGKNPHIPKTLRRKTTGQITGQRAMHAGQDMVVYSPSLHPGPAINQVPERLLWAGMTDVCLGKGPRYHRQPQKMGFLIRRKIFQGFINDTGLDHLLKLLRVIPEIFPACFSYGLHGSIKAEGMIAGQVFQHITEFPGQEIFQPRLLFEIDSHLPR